MIREMPFNELIKKLIPSSWFKDINNSSVWVAAFQVLRVKREDIPKDLGVIDIGKVRAVLLYGILPYIDSTQIKIEVIDEHHYKLPDASKFEVKETKEGMYLLLLTPHNIDGNEGNEVFVREQISYIAGLFAAFSGRNIVYDKIFDNIIHLRGDTEGSGPSIEQPLFFDKPDVSKLNIISNVGKIINNLSYTDRKNLQLSLRWFDMAIYDYGISAYIKYWIGLETLVKKGEINNKNNIKIKKNNKRPYFIYKKISDAYNIPFEDIDNLFNIRLLYKLRNAIIHDGQIVPIDGRLLEYIGAIYIDILFYCLGISHENKVDIVIEKFQKENFDIKICLYQILKLVKQNTKLGTIKTPEAELNTNLSSFFNRL